MTDTERERINAICEVAGVAEIDDLSDGFHTFRQLYYQRMMLFAVIVKQNHDRAWKSLRHEDGELCFGGGWFIVGIDTPEGSYTYHYEDNYYSLFDCEELERGKHWDGHTEKDVTRLLSLPNAQHSQEGTTKDTISRQAALEKVRTMQTYKLFMGDDMILVDKAEVQTELMMLPPAQPDENVQEFIKLTVRNSNGRPYYSIIYLEYDKNGVGHDIVGYSSYSLDVISDYLKKYFMPPAQPEVLACGSGELVAQPEPTDINAKEAVYNLAEKIGIHQLFALTVELRGEPIQPEPQWILCDERMPEEHEWIGTKKFGTTISDEVYVTFENEKGERFCQHMKFQNGELSRYDQFHMDTWFKGSKPIAWMPLPKPFEGGIK